MRPHCAKSNQIPSNELSLCVCDFVIVDKEVDPFIMYVIKSCRGDQHALVYRRFDQFKSLERKVRDLRFLFHD